VSHVPIPPFPADIRLSVYAHVTGGHGTDKYGRTFGTAEWHRGDRA